MCDIVSWKTPALTVTFLVLVDVGYIVFKSLNLSIISSALHKLFIFSIVMLLKTHLVGEQKDCGCYNKEKIERTYTYVYDKTNKLMDKLRKIVFLQEMPSLVRVKI